MNPINIIISKITTTKEYLSNIDMYFYERITFHPEYSYEDFVGQIMPIIKDDKM